MLTFVYPNTSDLNRGGRGGLKQRTTRARALGCGYVEVPADFVKNKTEVAITGLGLGSFLSAEATNALYDAGSSSPSSPYILHTEPSLPRTDGYGLSRQAEIRWRDPAWVNGLCEMLAGIGNRLGSPPAAIEIHPGDSRNSLDDLIRSMRSIQDRLGAAFSTPPLVLLENRTGQFVSTGTDLAAFAKRVVTEGEMAAGAGVVLDVQQLFTQTKSKFLEQLRLVPREFVLGLHVHTKHHAPSETDAIPWAEVFRWVGETSGDLLVNPEVLLASEVEKTIAFCRRMMGLPPYAA